MNDLTLQMQSTKLSHNTHSKTFPNTPQSYTNTDSMGSGQHSELTSADSQNKLLQKMNENVAQGKSMKKKKKQKK